MQPLSTSDLVLIGSTFALGCAAIFGPAFADKFRDWFFQAAPVIRVASETPACHLANSSFQLGGLAESHKTYVFRCEVRNAGKTQLKRSELVLEGLEIADSSGAFRPHSRFTPVSLYWGAGYEQFVDINPGRRFYHDLFHIPDALYQQHKRGLLRAYIDLDPAKKPAVGVVLETHPTLLSQPNCLPQGRYLLMLALYSENAPVVKIRVQVSWSGQWRDSEEEMFRECVMTSMS